MPASIVAPRAVRPQLRGGCSATESASETPSAPTRRASAQRCDSAPPSRMTAHPPFAAVFRLPLETVSFRAAPGAQIHLQSGSGSGDDDLPAGSRLPQGAFEEQISAFGESERFEIYLHCACNVFTNASTVAKSIDGGGELQVSADASGHPLLQPFEIEQRANLGIAIRHAEEELAESRDRRRGRIVENREVAVIVVGGLGENSRRAARNRPFPRECQMVRVEDAGGVGGAAEQGADRVTLAADVIPMLSSQHVTHLHLEVLAGLQPLLRQVVQRNQCRLRRVAGTDRDDPPFEVGDGFDPAVGSHQDDRSSDRDPCPACRWLRRGGRGLGRRALPEATPAENSTRCARAPARGPRPVVRSSKTTRSRTRDRGCESTAGNHPRWSRPSGRTPRRP